MRTYLIFSALLFSTAAFAADPPSGSTGAMVRFMATTANVPGAPDSIRIDLLRWSTEEEREKLMSAWEMKPAAGGRGGTATPGGRGAGAGPAGAGQAGAAGRAGGAAAGGRGGRGGGAPAGPPPTPESTLAAAIEAAPTVGYLWSSEAAGYSLRYAGNVTAPDGSHRIILITDRRLGATNGLWKLDGQSAPSNYEFTVIELRVNSKGEGEGKASLTGTVAPDSAAHILAPANYAALPVVLSRLKLESGKLP
jgi:hypothetical protein